jgi:predicted nucleotidyltransferase
MTSKPIDDPVLKRFKAALAQAYGNQIDRVVLFGSRARGDARPDSDYDVAVFLRDLPDRWREMDRLADIGSEILNDDGKLVHAMPYRADAYADRTPLMHEIRKDGLDLSSPKPKGSCSRHGNFCSKRKMRSNIGQTRLPALLTSRPFMPPRH